MTDPDEIKATGSHYTPPQLADFVAVQIIKNCRSRRPAVLDPACGDGELLLALKKHCPAARLTGFDLNHTVMETARTRLEGNFECRDFLAYSDDFRDDELFQQPNDRFDIVIANPPYIRTQVMGARKAQELSRRFRLSGRVDLYFAFLEGIADVLQPGGIAGVIVSNRFMTTKSGEVVRRRILERFDVLHVWDLGDTKLFKAAVLPAVLLLRKKDGSAAGSPRMTSIYTTTGNPSTKAASPIDALAHDGAVLIGGESFHVRQGGLDFSENVWRIASRHTHDWLATVRSNTYCTFRDVGKIRVGVKTTADKVFVRKNWAEPQPELLKPLVTHHIARRYKSHSPDRKILYPHMEVDGRKQAAALDDFPISKAYLESHRDALESRRYVIDAGRKWYEIWVPHQPGLWAMPKVVFPDISEEPTFWMSLEDEIIQGDCYWLASKDQNTELLWLALAVANSKFTGDFYDHSFHNKLYSGRRRFMTQYVEKFPLPDPNTKLAREIVDMVKKIYNKIDGIEAGSLAGKLDSCIYRAFGVEKITR